MTKNNYNAKHIELGKKFLANENVNIDLHTKWKTATGMVDF